jgi:hypothetical protein
LQEKVSGREEEIEQNDHFDRGGDDGLRSAEGPLEQAGAFDDHLGSGLIHLGSLFDLLCGLGHLLDRRAQCSKPVLRRAHTARQSLHPLLGRTGEAVHRGTCSAEQPEDHEGGAERLRNSGASESPNDGTQQEIEQHGEDDGEEKRPREIQRVERSEHEETGDGQRADLETFTQRLAQLLDVGLIHRLAGPGVR